MARKKRLPILFSARDVAEVLGGFHGVCKITGNESRSNHSNWLTLNQFPAKYYKAMHDALRRRGYTAPHALWDQRSASAKRRAA